MYAKYAYIFAKGRSFFFRSFYMQNVYRFCILNRRFHICVSSIRSCICTLEERGNTQSVCSDIIPLEKLNRHAGANDWIIIVWSESFILNYFKFPVRNRVSEITPESECHLGENCKITRRPSAEITSEKCHECFKSIAASLRGQICINIKVWPKKQKCFGSSTSYAARQTPERNAQSFIS